MREAIQIVICCCWTSSQSRTEQRLLCMQPAIHLCLVQSGGPRIRADNYHSMREPLFVPGLTN